MFRRKLKPIARQQNFLRSLRLLRLIFECEFSYYATFAFFAAKLSESGRDKSRPYFVNFVVN